MNGSDTAVKLRNAFCYRCYRFSYLPRRGIDRAAEACYKFNTIGRLIYFRMAYGTV
ncbi:MAG: hypothetical protein KAY65_02405 [Planctomycetes bacterium]|nr:hypothetical protein [Planctomycetota bacterium]